MYILYILTTDITTDNDCDKRQTRPLVREGVPGLNCQSQCDFDSDPSFIDCLSLAMDESSSINTDFRWRACFADSRSRNMCAEQCLGFCSRGKRKHTYN
jgi:hypothetical protein